jgi:uncharacterized protein YkwD
VQAVRLRRALLAGALVLAACVGGSPALAAQKRAHRAVRHHRGCAHTESAPNTSNIGAIRAATLCLINRERLAAGERPLRPNARLRRAAQTHSRSMAFDDYFEHVGGSGPGGGTPLTRLRAVGYISSSRVGYEFGENLAWGTLSLATPRAIVAAWMASPAHRANILNANYRETGIGVAPRPPASLAHGKPGAIYTQDFGVIIGR